MLPWLREQSWTVRVAACALAALTVGVGFCLFDGALGAPHHEGTDQHPSQDLCCGLLASSLLVTLLTHGAISSVPLEPSPVLCVATVRGIDPPPKSLSLS
mgnify:CR=1 FL=1